MSVSGGFGVHGWEVVHIKKCETNPKPHVANRNHPERGYGEGCAGRVGGRSSPSLTKQPLDGREGNEVMILRLFYTFRFFFVLVDRRKKPAGTQTSL